MDNQIKCENIFPKKKGVVRQRNGNLLWLGYYLFYSFSFISFSFKFLLHLQQSRSAQQASDKWLDHRSILVWYFIRSDLSQTEFNLSLPLLEKTRQLKKNTPPTFFNSLPLSVEQEGPKPARVQMVHHRHQQTLGKLKRGRELLLQLPHAVQPLDEHGRAVRVGVALVAVTYTLGERRTQEWASEGKNEWIRERLYEFMNPKMNNWTNECTNDIKN